MCCLDRNATSALFHLSDLRGALSEIERFALIGPHRVRAHLGRRGDRSAAARGTEVRRAIRRAVEPHATAEQASRRREVTLLHEAPRVACAAWQPSSRGGCSETSPSSISKLQGQDRGSSCWSCRAEGQLWAATPLRRPRLAPRTSTTRSTRCTRPWARRCCGSGSASIEALMRGRLQTSAASTGRRQQCSLAVRPVAACPTPNGRKAAGRCWLALRHTFSCMCRAGDPTGPIAITTGATGRRRP